MKRLSLTAILVVFGMFSSIYGQDDYTQKKMGNSKPVVERNVEVEKVSTDSDLEENLINKNQEKEEYTRTAASIKSGKQEVSQHEIDASKGVVEKSTKPRKKKYYVSPEEIAEQKRLKEARLNNSDNQ